MNKREHVMNAVLLAVGLGVILEPSLTISTGRRIAEIFVPVVLGALFPDIDTAFGDHRKTFHNLITLGVFLAYPFFLNNLHFVWIGIITHYVLDLLGTTRGIALLYPWKEEFDIPVGVTTGSRWAPVVTVVVTGLELAVLAIVRYYITVLDIETDVGQAANTIGTALGL